jgi:hypothetical protein
MGKLKKLGFLTDFSGCRTLSKNRSPKNKTAFESRFVVPYTVSP